MSAFFSFVLYVVVLLRVRGNLIQDIAGTWSLRWIPRSQSWQLGFARDYLDSCLVKMAAIIVWFACSMYLSSPSLTRLCYSRYPVGLMVYPSEAVDEIGLTGASTLGDIHRAHRPNFDCALRKLCRCPRPSCIHLSGRFNICARRSVVPRYVCPCTASDS